MEKCIVYWKRIEKLICTIDMWQKSLQISLFSFLWICEEVRFEDLNNCYFILEIDVIETMFFYITWILWGERQADAHSKKEGILQSL